MGHAHRFAQADLALTEWRCATWPGETGSAQVCQIAHTIKAMHVGCDDRADPRALLAEKRAAVRPQPGSTGAAPAIIRPETSAQPWPSAADAEYCTTPCGAAT
ncbi:hypothetical protein MSAS_48520 [Mycobacterium saskatchewanense]|nr:hypothetical protein MSAS_48520 [Mycobacterium saskatchewanense]